MKRVAVTSEAILSIGYENSTLEIEFVGGDVYRYFLIPEREYRGLILAESMGAYLAKYIRDRYGFLQVN
ncbi:hypothetical protein BH11ACT5_BH11ACT5_05520 [soil metagenome]